jgi:GntR family transcriptional regulator, transcriptional repressor for pyruvate dehydrogenase complex
MDLEQHESGVTAVSRDERSRSVAALQLERIAPDSVSLEVSRKLLRLVVSGEVAAGTRLPSERVLSQQLGVARNAIRDGLRPLVLLGMLEVRPGSGTYVKSTTSDLLPEIIEWGLLLGEPRLQELIEARFHVEIVLSRLAAERRDAEAVRTLRSLVRKMSDARSVQEFSVADLAFHLKIADAARNEVLAGMLRSIRTLVTVWIRRVVTAERDLAELTREHLAILEAVEAQDPIAAGEAMEEHLTTVIDRLSAGLEAQRIAEAIPAT